MEQLELSMNYKDNIFCYLKRSKEPIKCNVEIDEMTKIATNNFDFEFNEEIEFYPFEFTNELKKLDFDILCIVGGSGSGKSTFSKNYGIEENLVWDNKKSIISHFKNEKEAIEKLSSVGLNSIPTWLKPRNVLSVGEGFRCDLARRIKNNCVIDEFTSTIDREVAISCSTSIGKYIRKNGLKKCVFVSCHKDFIDYLKPSYVIDLDDGVVYDTRRLPKRNIKLQLYEEKDKQRLWNIFKQHHYLSHDLNYACKMFSLRLNNNQIAICCVLPMPNGCFNNGFRIHRLVVLPEYQGLGIGTLFIKIICSIYKKFDKVMYIRTSHPKLRNYFDSSNDWVSTKRSGTISPSLFDKKPSKGRIAYSYKYIGNNKYDIQNINLLDIKKNKQKIDQTTIFDYLED